MAAGLSASAKAHSVVTEFGPKNGRSNQGLSHLL